MKPHYYRDNNNNCDLKYDELPDFSDRLTNTRPMSRAFRRELLFVFTGLNPNQFQALQYHFEILKVICGTEN